MRKCNEPVREKAEIRHPVMMEKNFPPQGGPVTSGLLVTINAASGGK
jgi:hypothetical protein